MEQPNRTNKKRKVMIGTPCYDGRLDVWYVNSFSNTVKESFKRNIEILPMWVSFDALIQRARNDTIDVALQWDVDDLIWIDSDIEWEPEDFYKLLDYPVDVVGGTYRKKGDKEEYVLREFEGFTKVDPSTGLMSVRGLGTGFVRMSKKACKYLWDTAPSYIDPKDDRERRLIFNVVVEDFPLKGHPTPVPSLVSEDIYAFNNLVKGGFDVWMDPTITCKHTGPYKFVGDYLYWYNSGKWKQDPAPIGPPAVESDPRVRAEKAPPQPIRQTPEQHAAKYAPARPNLRQQITPPSLNRNTRQL